MAALVDSAQLSNALEATYLVSEALAAIESTANPKRLDVAIAQNSENPWISIEFFPPKTPVGVGNMFKHLEILSKRSPLFVDMTWGAGGSTSDLTMDLCKRIAEQGHRVNMHLTCTNMEASKLSTALKQCLEHGILNILALRGDPPAGQSRWIAEDLGLTCALDLVKYIHREYPNNEFCVSVAGYPEGHPDAITPFTSLDDMTESERARHSVEVKETGETVYYACSDDNYKKEINYLKEKVEAGSNCIITQMFFDTEVYVSFVQACREAGITVPIVPGIMCVASYAGFKRMIQFCKTRVPEAIASAIEELKGDDEGIKKYGIELGQKMSTRLLEVGALGLHYYTLNSSVATEAILEGIKLAF